MASERDEALNAVLSNEAAETSNLAVVIADGARLAEETKHLKLTHEHAINMKRADLGWFGRILGNEANAAIVIAFIVVVLGFSTAIALWTAAYFTPNEQFWASEAHIALAAATTALGYVFGRGSNESKR
jgi:hypothetical protein